MANTMSPNTYVQLPNGIRMPSIGLGTFKVPCEDAEEAVMTAVDEAGYRHIDTAALYVNEVAIGRALKRLMDASKVKREDLFIVTKLPQIAMKAAKVEEYLRRSLKDLQLDYVDLYLVHWPHGLVDRGDNDFFPVDADGNVLLDPTTDHVAIWKKMEEMVDKGLTKTIGLSNFNIRQIQRVLDNARIKPANLQVECHAYFQQTELFDYCVDNGITFTAYAPLACPDLGLFLEKFGVQETEMPALLQEPTLKAIAERLKKSNAQILLRWCIQRGMIVIPKSVNPIRMKENIDVFDFELSPADIKVINNLDRNLRLVRIDFIKGITSHPEYPFRL